MVAIESNKLTVHLISNEPFTYLHRLFYTLSKLLENQKPTAESEQLTRETLAFLEQLLPTPELLKQGIQPKACQKLELAISAQNIEALNE
jgi:hypothetical protein